MTDTPATDLTSGELVATDDRANSLGRGLRCPRLGRAPTAPSPAGSETAPGSALPAPGICSRIPPQTAARRGDSCYGLGTAYARGGQWDNAAAAFRQATELSPADLPTLFKTASLSFHTGNVETYRHACKALVQHFGATDNIQVADCTIKACALAPDFGADPQKVTRLAAAETFRAQTGPAREWFDLARALVELRAGRSNSAAEIITRSAPSQGTHRDASAFAILAMARHGPGNGDDARAALSNARRIMAAKMPKPEKGETFGDDWHDWLHARILCREAEEMLAGPAPRP